MTGCNAVWIAGGWTGTLPDVVLVPAVTRARELLDAGAALSRAGGLRRVIELPVDLGDLDEADRNRIHRFLRWAKGMGADKSWVARHRRAWWAVGLRPPAPGGRCHGRAWAENIDTRPGYRDQSSSSNPGTRSKSRVFRVAKVTLCTSAVAAIRRSRLPARSRIARRS